MTSLYSPQFKCDSNKKIMCNYREGYANWQVKQALSGEMDGKLCIATHAHILLLVGMYICCFTTWRVHGKFYRLDLKNWLSWKTRARFISDEENGCVL